MSKFDENFNQFHGSGVRVCEAPFDKLFDIIINEYPTINPKVVKLYLKVKFFARLKQLNQEIKMNKLKQNTVRAMKQTAQFFN